RNYEVKTADLRETVELLCRLPLEERRRVSGLDADRADIIPAGAAILMTILEDVEAERITTSDLGLRYGILVDRVTREDAARETYASTPVRLRSILQLARACGFDERHAR